MSRKIIQDLIDHVTSECTAIDVEERYRDLLRELYDFKQIGGPFAHLDPAAVLEEMSPTDFRVGCADMLDGHEDYEIKGENYEKRDIDRAAEEFIGNLEDELSDLEDDRDEIETELEQAGEDEESGEQITERLDELNARIDDKQADIDACRAHSF